MALPTDDTTAWNANALVSMVQALYEREREPENERLLGPVLNVAAAWVDAGFVTHLNEASRK